MKLNNKIKIVRVPVFRPFFLSGFLEAPYFPPLGLATITAYLRSKGLNVEQQDLNIEVHKSILTSKNKFNANVFFDKKRVFDYLKGKKDKYLDFLSEKISKEMNINNEVKILLLSIEENFMISPILSALLIANYWKNKYSNLIIIAGGSETLYELFPFMNNPKLFDFLVYGCGEISVYKLIKNIENKTAFKKISGLIYYDKKIIKKTLPKLTKPVKPDFDDLPLEKYMWSPNKHFNNYKLLKHKKIEPFLILPYQFISGCPFHCAFCPMSGIKEYYLKNPKEVVEDLKFLSEKYNTKYFFFLNSNINVSKKYIISLCDEIIKSELKIFWMDCARFDNINRMILTKMKKAGCISLTFGLETTSERLLKYVHKNINIEKVPGILKIASELGIWTAVEIIAGLPTETEKDIQTTKNFLKKNIKYLDNIFFFTFHIEPHSLFLKYPEKYGLKNIKKSASFSTMKQLTSAVNFRYSFDEIGGLCWEHKKNQIANSFSKLRYDNYMNENIYQYDSVPFLFSLYSVFDNKDLIKDAYFEVKNKLYKKYLFEPCFFIKTISRFKSFSELRRKGISFLSWAFKITK
ncbi:MAG: B12-binding domain-containing radical SAM protein [Nanoarchaeota archaeon]|nr:B12-binding domain-containing radical SAM protein [Nanoarchaeota archaeon]